MDGELEKTRSLELVFTGDRKNGQFGLSVNGEVVWLTYGQLSIMVTLAIARGTTAYGFAENPDVLHPKSICLLRRLFDSVGAGLGRRLIETGGRAEYRMGDAGVYLDSGFAELVAVGALVQDEFQTLNRLYETVDVSKTTGS